MPEVWQMGSDGTAVSVCSLSLWEREPTEQD